MHHRTRRLKLCSHQESEIPPSKEGVPENLRKQLAVAVRSVQWSYAIFWSLSTTQEGVLEWGDGYYNGDIKTRKTVQTQTMEPKADKMGLQRSKQLGELYESLLEDETDQAKRPAAALSPEDLTDAEWYYLVCMSFVFNRGEGLPGRALVNTKSASIQTVVCFPHFGGIIELGVTELVLEDLSLIQHIKTSLLQFSKPVCSEKSSSAAHNTDDDTDCMLAKVDHGIADAVAMENFCSPTDDIRFDQEGFSELDENIHDDFAMGSPDDCSNGCEHNHQMEDSFVPEGINGGASQVQSWHFMDDDFSNCAQGSINLSDCISQVFTDQEKDTSPPRSGNVNNLHLKELQECNHTKLSSLDPGNDLSNRRTLSTILRNSHRLIENTCFQSCTQKSSFVSWKKGGIDDGERPQEQQNMLKKLLIRVPLMHRGCSLKLQNETGGKDWLWKPEIDEICVQHSLPDKVTENEKILVLRSTAPSVSKIAKALVLGGIIEYLKGLEARVEELESCIDLAEYEARARRKYPDMVEQISDNYENKRISSVKKSSINKRKASDIDETDSELNIDGPQLDMKVSTDEQEVLTEFRGAAFASTRMIKQALSRIAGNC
ncbi:hypothetical protein F0562_014887 [Nyssa sinensis]|uniref:Transcription factor MYC/MYB N-terminal domain-containing protein n=1 Tax=Nyssa sinensis TaxID=561372 RepID=A0A5J4ZU50_9ASTE|nr:hypothetical protein F0562_014887 [Nyssa sinensis]